MLIAVDPGKHLRAGFIPLGRSQLVAAEIFLQRLGVDIERRVAVRVARDDLCRSRSALAAENLFLRKQLTFFVERKQAPRRTDNATRVTMATLARLFDWKEAVPSIFQSSFSCRFESSSTWRRPRTRPSLRFRARDSGRRGDRCGCSPHRSRHRRRRKPERDSRYRRGPSRA